MSKQPHDTDEDRDVNAPSAAELLDALDIGVFRIEAKSGRVLWGSTALARLMGYSDQGPPASANALDHYTDPLERKEALTRFFGRGGADAPRVLRVESKRKRYDTGEPIDVRMNIAPRYDDTGSLTLLDGTMEAIGAGGAAIEKAFKLSEERFRIVFEEATLGMIITDPQGRILRVNRCFCQICGQNEDQLLGRDIQSLLDSSLKQRDIVSTDDDQEGEVEEFLFASRQRGPVWVYVNRCWLRDEHARPHSAVLMVQDITSRKRAEEALLRLDKLESVALLAGGVAHDFNNVLTGIAGNISLARNAIGDRDKAARFLALAEESTLRAKTLTDQLLTFARGGNPAIRPTALEELIEHAALFCLGGVKTSHTLKIASDVSPARCDAGQLSQVLNNLLINAVQAMMEEGSIEIELANVEIGASSNLPLAAGPYCRVSVTDSGPGIAPHDLPRIFDPYFSTKAGGSGLGLATSHAIVRRHGGHIDVSTQLGEGTRFDVYLPAALGVPAPDPPETMAVPNALGGRMLILDDEEVICAMVEAVLGRVGVDVECARDGAQALERFSEALEQGRAFDAVILDLTVPGGLGGLEILPRLMQLDKQIKAIVSSGYAANDVMADFQAHGFVAALPKPYSTDELMRVVARFLPARA